MPLVDKSAVSLQGRDVFVLEKMDVFNNLELVSDDL